MDGDGLAGVDPAERDLLPGDHDYAGGRRNGSINAHCRSDRSLGYPALSLITRRYAAPARRASTTSASFTTSSDNESFRKSDENIITRESGAIVYLAAALDVHRDTLIGRCVPTTGITPFADLVTKVMTREPYAWARRVCWIVDNGASHRGHASVDRMAKAWPTATFIHLPVHASWLSQVEICFSIVQRKVLTTNDFLDLADVVARLKAFEGHYNFIAKPFN